MIFIKPSAIYSGGWQFETRLKQIQTFYFVSCFSLSGQVLLVNVLISSSVCSCCSVLYYTVVVMQDLRHL
jgi:hypothetical protein